MPLGRLPAEEVRKHIQERFASGKMAVQKEVLGLIAEKGAGHPYYTQLLCHILWDECLEKKVITVKDVESALDKMLKREGEVYETILDDLTQKQKHLLIAMGLESKAKVFSAQFLSKYHLGSASSIQKALQSLIEKDLLDRENDYFIFQDPFFALWLEKKQ